MTTRSSSRSTEMKNIKTCRTAGTEALMWCELARKRGKNTNVGNRPGKLAV